jgi:DNA-binding transcriptional LysR family regulator
MPRRAGLDEAAARRRLRAVDTLVSIKVFQQVVQDGSFVAAAEHLDLSTASVSKHVMSLEKRLGVRLLSRSSRALSLTEPGRVYFERSKTIVDDLETMELELGSLNTAARGTLRVTAPTWLAGQRLADLVARYQTLYPEIVIDVSFDDRVVDLVAEGYDLAVRVVPHDLLPAGLIARPLRDVTSVLGGSRDYLKRMGTPISPQELGNHRFVALGGSDVLSLTGPTGPIDITMKVVMRYRSVMGIANAVAAGIGLAVLPDVFFEDQMLKQVVKPVLPAYRMPTRTSHLVYVSRKYVPFKIRSFVDFALDPANRVGTPTIEGVD